MISTIANAGFENVSLDDLKESIQDLLRIREKAPLPALGVPGERNKSNQMETRSSASIVVNFMKGASANARRHAGCETFNKFHILQSPQIT